jgi:copper chaperone
MLESFRRPMLSIKVEVSRVKQTVALEIGGMSCQMCVKHVTSALGEIEGVDVRNVSVGSAEVEVDPSQVPESRLVEAVGEAGYEARVVRR